MFQQLLSFLSAVRMFVSCLADRPVLKYRKIELTLGVLEKPVGSSVGLHRILSLQLK